MKGSFFSLIIFVSVLAPSCVEAASSRLVWTQYDDNFNILRQTLFEDGATVGVMLNETRLAWVETDFYEGEVVGDLYFINPNTLEREAISLVGSNWGTEELAWAKEGSYELDVYDVPLMQVRRPSWKNFLVHFLPQVAYAAPEGLDENWFVETIRFSVIEGEAGDCCSSILFLPGIMGSRLEENGTRRWEPTDDIGFTRLYLDEVGKSANSGITATGVIDEFVFSSTSADPNIYKSFLVDLAAKKNDDTIADYVAYPYDWRLSISDIVLGGELEQNLRDLASSSKTGKVAIVAHSNGGLVAKALLNALGTDASNLVDQLILVGVPQLGTPKALGALLHGFETGIPFNWLPLVLSPERGRDFAKNAPFIYHLFPHPDYYQNAGTSIATPVISFNPGTKTALFYDAYGLVIGNNDELSRFVLGTEGRNEAQYLDLESPAKGNLLVFDSARTILSNIGASWIPPTDVVVHQIAGIGEDTLAGITYSSGRGCTRAVITPLPIVGTKLFCLEYSEKLLYTPNEVIDGDGTVVVPSALVMNDEADNMKRWWVNLVDHNSVLRKNRDHKDLLEIDNLRSFIFDNLISNSTDNLPEFLHNNPPAINTGNRLRFILHSPLTLSVTAGDIEYPTRRYGEVQIATVPANISSTMTLNGIEDGSFTLEIEELTEDTIIASTIFSGIPSSTDTIATISFPDGTIQNADGLKVDYDGDGTVDLEIEVLEGETVTIPEPSLAALLAILKDTIVSLDINERLKNNLLKRVTNLEKKIEKKKERNIRILSRLEGDITKRTTKGKIDANDASAILVLFDELEAQADFVLFDPFLLLELKNSILSSSLKQKPKDNLVKRIEILEKRQGFVHILTNLTNSILRKGKKGMIQGADVIIMLQLLEQIEANI